MKRKLFATALTVLLTLTLYTGCTRSTEAPQSAQEPDSSSPAADPAGGEGPETGTELLFWDYHDNEEGAFFDRVSADYMAENPSVTIVREQIPWDDYMSGTKMTVAFASNEGPDIFMVSDALFLKYANSAVLAPLDSYLSDTVREDFIQSSLDAATIDGKLYAIPFENELRGLFYDIDKLEAAGITPQQTGRNCGTPPLC